jgi:putative alpha-1,2-mannosidase
MAAQHEIALIVAARQKGLRSFDQDFAWSAIHKAVTQPGEPYTCNGTYPQGFAGDRHLRPYLEFGFVPEEAGPASSTFEYAYDDACAAVFARSLGRRADAAYFAKLAQNWRNAFDQETRYARRRHADGAWVTPFDPMQYGTSGGWNGSGFVEGTPWIYSWFVPHDVSGLVRELGENRFNQRLEEGFNNNYVDLTNEPNIQSPWLFNFSGKPWLTQKYARNVFARSIHLR